MATTDLAIIGAGPGGYVAALRAAQLGMKVTLIESTHLGGVCLNRGCIPTKAMLQTAAIAHEVRAAADFGVTTQGQVGIDYATVLGRRDAVVARLRNGVRGLLRQAKVEIVAGTASFVAPTAVSIEPTAADIGAGKGTAAARAQTLEAAHILVATGSRSTVLDIPGVEHPRVLDSDGALSLKSVPSSLLVVGAGPVGCEWSIIFARLGSKVTLIDMLPSILPREDPDISKILAKSLAAEGVSIHTETVVEAIREEAGGLSVEFPGAAPRSLPAEYVLVAAGRLPHTEGLNLAAVGVKTDSRGFILTNPYQVTNVPSVLAIGDVTGQALLAHVASRQGIVAVEKLAGLSPQPVRPDRIPSITYTDPEVASVGLTEAQAGETGQEVLVGRFPFSASGRAQTQASDSGLVKVVAESRFGQVLGVHMVGLHVGELLAEAVLAMELEATLDELSSVIRAHPTLSEALGEAALAAAGCGLHGG